LKLVWLKSGVVCTYSIRVIRTIRVIRDKESFASSGVTLVELLVALTIASILILGVLAAFQTTQRTAAIGEAREQIYQNARVALDLMSKEIKNAYIDHRNRDLVFISADGLAGRSNSILQYDPANPTNPFANPTLWIHGLGNAQVPFGIALTVDPSPNFTRWPYTESMVLYADETFGPPYWSMSSIKAINDIYTLSPGPPDRLDFCSLTSTLAGATNESRLRFVRYMVLTETFVDDVDNDYDGLVDENDNVPDATPVGIPGVGDLIPIDNADDFNPVTKKILALSLFQLHRAMDVYDRYPARAMVDWDYNYNSASRTDENIGSYIYDVQFEFYGRIAIALKSDGSPEVWGTGWGYQDVRGEDIGTDCDRQLSDAGDLGPYAIQSGYVDVTKDSARVGQSTTTPPSWPTTLSKLAGGTFFIWPSSYTAIDTFDTTDPNNDVYTIIDVDTGTGELILDRPYEGATATDAAYRIIEPTQANGVLDKVGNVYPEDVGSDGLMGDPLDDSTNIPNNVSDNDGVVLESSIGECNRRLDSRVMGVWDSRSPDPRNPRKASELNGWDDDDDYDVLAYNVDASSNPIDDDADGQANDRLDDHYGPGGVLIQRPTDGQSLPWAAEESDIPVMTVEDDGNDLIDTDSDGVVDDRFYEPAGKPEGVDEQDEANPYDDSLPQAVRITIAVRDSQQSLEPVVLSTVVWLSTAK
jgi:prepilin-type N-terminal cleavage/methylation domain-containing protein